MVIPIINNTQLSDLNDSSFNSDVFGLYMMGMFFSALSGKSTFIFFLLCLSLTYSLSWSVSGTVSSSVQRAWACASVLTWAVCDPY